MVRRLTPRPGALVLALGVGLAVVGLFGVRSALAVAGARADRPAASTLVYLMQAPIESTSTDGVARISGPDSITYLLASIAPAGPSWNSVAGLVGAVLLFVLLVAIAVSAARRGLYATGTRRLLGLTGLLGTGGGGAAILVTAIRHSPQWSEAAPFLVWVLIGCALLAMRELLARAGALRSELDGVI